MAVRRKSRGPIIKVAGERFGRWTAIEWRSPQPGSHNSVWLCRCECGVERLIQINNLMNGSSAGCRDCCLKHRGRDLTDKTVGPFRVIGIVWPQVGRRAWRVRCRGGVEHQVGGRTLLTRKTETCWICR